ncbi:hypothetical protein C8Q73DRAFT_14054 [Cubamyces lactineus]|nr:hypothetical protein C8Q73DRAFT_14054 [Cubamyces lactineus]
MVHSPIPAPTTHHLCGPQRGDRLGVALSRRVYGFSYSRCLRLTPRSGPPCSSTTQGCGRRRTRILSGSVGEYGIGALSHTLSLLHLGNFLHVLSYIDNQQRPRGARRTRPVLFVSFSLATAPVSVPCRYSDKHCEMAASVFLGLSRPPVDSAAHAALAVRSWWYLPSPGPRSKITGGRRRLNGGKPAESYARTILGHGHHTPGIGTRSLPPHTQAHNRAKIMQHRQGPGASDFHYDYTLAGSSSISNRQASRARSPSRPLACPTDRKLFPL